MSGGNYFRKRNLRDVTSKNSNLKQQRVLGVMNSPKSLVEIKKEENILKTQDASKAKGQKSKGFKDLVVEHPIGFTI